MERPRNTMVRGRITPADEFKVSIAVTDILSDTGSGRAWQPGTTVSFGTYASENAAERLRSPVAESEDGLAAAVLVRADGHINLLLPLDETGQRLAREVGVGSPTLYHNTNTLAAGIDEGQIVATVMPPIDPGRASWCQNSNPKRQTFTATSGDEVAELLAFGRALLVAERAEDLERELNATAEPMANESRFTDEVTGQFTHGYATDIVDQLRGGTPITEVVVHRTVPVSLIPGRLLWVEDQRAVLVLAEAGTGRLLGWIDFAGYGPRETPLPAGVLEVMVPPTGADIEAHLRVLEPGFECLEGAGEPATVIPFDAIVGTGRAEIDLDTSTVKPWG